jgi:hypothetical protein
MSIFLKCNFKSIFNYISAEIRTHPIMIFLNIARRATTASGYIVERHYYPFLLDNFKNSVMIMEQELQQHTENCMAQNCMAQNCMACELKSNY